MEFGLRKFADENLAVMGKWVSLLARTSFAAISYSSPSILDSSMGEEFKKSMRMGLSALV
jgi:hypothetical protein